MDYKTNTIKDVIEKGNNKNAAAVRLGVTKRSINRIKKKERLALSMATEVVSQQIN